MNLSPNSSLENINIFPIYWKPIIQTELFSIDRFRALHHHIASGTQASFAIRLHFDSTNNIAEYEALVNGLRIMAKVGARRLLVRGDSKLVVDQVMKAMEPHNPKMYVYYDESSKKRSKASNCTIATNVSMLRLMSYQP